MQCIWCRKNEAGLEAHGISFTVSGLKFQIRCKDEHTCLPCAKARLVQPFEQYGSKLLSRSTNSSFTVDWDYFAIIDQEALREEVDSHIRILDALDILSPVLQGNWLILDGMIGMSMIPTIGITKYYFVREADVVAYSQKRITLASGYCLIHVDKVI